MLQVILLMCQLWQLLSESLKLMVLISLADTGPGAAAEELPLLTRKFFRGQNAGGISGAGLGLYLSRYFMEKMRGGLKCENTSPGFRVILTLELV